MNSSITVRWAEKKDHKYIIDLLNQVFTDKDDYCFSSNFPVLTDISNTERMCVAEDADSGIIGAVLHYPLEFVTPVLTIRAAGVGGVAVEKSFRKRGLSSLLMNETIARLTREKYDIAILWTDLHDMYRKFGFELCARQRSYTVSRALINSSVPANDDVEIIEDRNTVAAEAPALYERHPYRVNRDSNAWALHMKTTDARFFCSKNKKSEKITAYCIYEKGPDMKKHIHEWAGNPDDLLHLFNHVANSVGENIYILSHSYIDEKIHARLEKTSVSVNEGYLGMIRSINPDLIGKKLKSTSANLEKLVLDDKRFGFSNNFLDKLDHTDWIKLVFGPEHPSYFHDFNEFNSALDETFPIKLWCWGFDSV